MKVLNLYAGVGGNRKLWENVEVTAVELDEEIADIYKDLYPNDTVIVGDAHEYLLNHYKKYDFIWTSPPCQSHSRARFGGHKNSGKVKTLYPDMKLYQEIIFLDNYYSGYWLVENVDPFYTPLIPASKKLGRHLFWSNFYISNPDLIKEADINRGNISEYSQVHGIDISKYKIKNRKDQILRNCVNPDLGLHILNCAIKKPALQTNLFA